MPIDTISHSNARLPDQIGNFANYASNYHIPVKKFSQVSHLFHRQKMLALLMPMQKMIDNHHKTLHTAYKH